MTRFKKLWFLFFLCFACIYSHAQNINWMLGTWNMTGNAKPQVIRTIVIDSVSEQNFAGKKTNEVNDRSHAKIITALSGNFNNGQLYIQNGTVLYKKEPKNGKWLDCSFCTPENKITIKEDSVILSSRITGCHKDCDGVSVYYKLLCDYDSVTQRYLVNLFGTPSDIAAFKPCIKHPPEIIASDPDAIKHVNEDSIRNADKIAKQKEQQRKQDSIINAANIAKKRQKQIDDSVKHEIALAEKRLQFINDSIAVAKQKEQQRRKDSLEAAAAYIRKRQREIQDSITLAQKRQKHIDDSLQTVAAIAKQKEQQRIQDSITNAANIAKKRQQQIDDSTKNAIIIAKKRQQQIDDSISVAKKHQQQIDDSLQTVAAIAKQKEQQRIQDSVANAANIAKKRQQQIDDSTKNVAIAAKKRQQQIDDSISVAKKHQQHIDDSLQTVAAIAKQKEQQRIQDSITNAANIAKKRQQQIDDSTKNAIIIAKKRQQQIDDSISLAKKHQQHINDSLQTVAAIAKQKEQQRIQDSINNAVANKNPVSKDTAKASTTKALETRNNVLLQTYHITTPDILIELFDNAQIDGDKVSVYHNGTLIVNNKTLLREPITFKIHADTTNRMHEFIMIAENLGTIPPNTALMRITAGKQIYKLSVKTDLQTNAKIVFYYDGN